MDDETPLTEEQEAERQAWLAQLRAETLTAIELAKEKAKAAPRPLWGGKLTRRPPKLGRPPDLDYGVGGSPA